MRNGTLSFLITEMVLLQHRSPQIHLCTAPLERWLQIQVLSQKPDTRLTDGILRRTEPEHIMTRVSPITSLPAL